jgi:hypothetical protein
MFCNGIARVGVNQDTKKRQDNGIGRIDRIFLFRVVAEVWFKCASSINPVDPENPVIQSF